MRGPRLTLPSLEDPAEGMGASDAPSPSPGKRDAPPPRSRSVPDKARSRSVPDKAATCISPRIRPLQPHLWLLALHDSRHAIRLPLHRHGDEATPPSASWACRRETLSLAHPCGTVGGVCFESEGSGRYVSYFRCHALVPKASLASNSPRSCRLARDGGLPQIFTATRSY
jgi:hypothetical protein